MIPPTIEATIADFREATKCLITRGTKGTIGGPGILHYAAHELERLQARCAALEAALLAVDSDIDAGRGRISAQAHTQVVAALSRRVGAPDAPAEGAKE